MNKVVPNGLMIMLEGIDGTGKSTQLSLAAASLRGEGWPVYTTRAHGGSEIGEALRAVSHSDLPRPAETDMYLSLAIHHALLSELAIHRQEGHIILVDRSPLSIVAYQLYGDGVDDKQGWTLVDDDIDNFKPDLIILYAASVATALRRAQQKVGGNADQFGSRPQDYFERAAQGYAVAAEHYGSLVHIIDAERSLEMVQADTMRAIFQSLDLKTTGGEADFS